MTKPKSAGGEIAPGSTFTVGEAGPETFAIPFAQVFPFAGRFLNGVPARPMVAAEAIAARLVATGAFTYEAPPPELDPETGEQAAIEVVEFPESALAALDFYAPIEPEPEPAPAADDPTTPEG